MHQLIAVAAGNEPQVEAKIKVISFPLCRIQSRFLPNIQLRSWIQIQLSALSSHSFWDNWMPLLICDKMTVNKAAWPDVKQPCYVSLWVLIQKATAPHLLIPRDKKLQFAYKDGRMLLSEQQQNSSFNWCLQKRLQRGV